jgi:hypothetical protein
MSTMSTWFRGLSRKLKIVIVAIPLLLLVAVVYDSTLNSSAPDDSSTSSRRVPSDTPSAGTASAGSSSVAEMVPNPVSNAVLESVAGQAVKIASILGDVAISGNDKNAQLAELNEEPYAIAGTVASPLPSPAPKTEGTAVFADWEFVAANKLTATVRKGGETYFITMGLEGSVWKVTGVNSKSCSTLTICDLDIERGDSDSPGDDMPVDPQYDTKMGG